MYQTDKIAILLATYNGEKYLAEQLDSLLNQTNQRWMAYIHDDGSNDETLSIIDKYVRDYPEHFIKVKGASTGSAKTNFFYLMGQVDAPYVMCCDQDDVWLPHKIQMTIDAMHQLEDKWKNELEVNEKPFLVFTELKIVDANLNVLAERMSDIQSLDCSRTKSSDIVIQNYVTGCTMMINRTLNHLATGKSTTNKQRHNIEAIDLSKIIMHDWWCALIASEYGEIQFIQDVTILYRQHGDNSVGFKPVNSFRYLLQKLGKVQEIKKSLELTRIQAREFASVYHLPANNLITQYGTIADKNRRERMQFYRENHISKTGISRNIGFWLMG